MRTTVVVPTFFKLLRSCVLGGLTGLALISLPAYGADTNAPPAAKTNAAPVVRWVSPASGEKLVAGDSVTLSAQAKDPSGITNMEFFASDKSLGLGHPLLTFVATEYTTYQLNWTNLAAGSYALKAVARAASGLNATSAPVTLTVQAKPVPHLSVSITSPENNSHVDFGKSIEVVASASYGDKAASNVLFMANGQFIGNGKVSPGSRSFSYNWTNAVVGTNSLTAIATADGGVIATSAPVNVVVSVPVVIVTAHRDLPRSYTPAIPFQILIEVTAKGPVASYSVQDQTPPGVAVASISSSGVFSSGKVTFGPFTNKESRILSYVVTVPATATGDVSFAGQILINGTNQPVTGDNTVTYNNPKHPADISPADNNLSTSELAPYAASWKIGKSWTSSTTNNVLIPVDYVTRAAFLAKYGGGYSFDPRSGDLPRAWISTSTNAPKNIAVPRHPSTRTVSVTNGIATIQLFIQGVSNVTAYAVEESLPKNWVVATTSDSAAASNGVIRWGPFYDGLDRTLSYSATIPTNASQQSFRGVLSFDGASESISGGGRSLISRILIHLRHVGNRLNVQLSEPVDQDAVIESADSVNAEVWTEAGTVSAGGSDADISDDSGNGQRFFRLRLLP